MDVGGISRVEFGGFGASTTSRTQGGASSPASGSSADSAAPSQDGIYYSSPVFLQDALTGALIEVWRDPRTGEQIAQSPSRAALLYRRSQDLSPARDGGDQPGAASGGTASDRSAAGQTRVSLLA